MSLQPWFYIEEGIYFLAIYDQLSLFTVMNLDLFYFFWIWKALLVILRCCIQYAKGKSSNIIDKQLQSILKFEVWVK